MKLSHIQPVWLLLVLKATGAPVTSRDASTNLPIVDLGYERHQAISFDEEAKTYNFSNIRYAQAPVGNLRFRAPVAPVGNSSEIDDGSVGKICSQPASLFSNVALTKWVEAYIEGTTLDYEELVKEYANESTPVSSADPRVTEDCLFLDVTVSKEVFDQRDNGTGAPVLVWIHGGGYTTGEKTGFGVYDPAGLVQASRSAGDDGFVFVAINYRLGAFGFLAGSTVQADGTANAGLLDQRMALDWVKENIYLFGGSPDRVTIAGESAGGGSVLTQLTAYGGTQGSVPFQQIVPQSAALTIAASAESSEESLQTIFTALNVSTMAELRAVSWSDIDKVNTYLCDEERLLFFGPSVDDSFMPEQVAALLADGKFDQNVTAYIGANLREGLLFCDPTVNSSAAYSTYLRDLIPGVTNASVSHIENVLYPEVFDGSYGYENQFERSVLTIQELVFTCNTPMLSSALQNNTKSYLFAVPPGLHGEDVPYSFYHGENTEAFVITSPPTTAAEIRVAGIMQTWLATFIANGTPTNANVLSFEEYGSDANVLVVDVNNNTNSTKISRGVDPAFVSGRCAWFSEAIASGTLVE